MTHRERLLRTLRFQEVDRVPDYEFGAWRQTIDRWHGEGLPQEHTDRLRAIAEYFKTDELETGRPPGLIDIKMEIFPEFEEKVLEEKGDHIIFQDVQGAICEMMKPELGASIPKYLRFPIETRQDWEKLRDERLNPDTPGRIPDNLEELCKATLDSDLPSSVNCVSLYGRTRNRMGVENLSLAVYDDPSWVEEIMEHLTQLKLTLLEKIAGKAKIDIAWWWEDMCFRSGPLLSPKHFAKWMVPRYKRITDFLRRECGCEFNILDCDGNIHELVPLWLEGGINVMFPLEVPHTDACKISDEFAQSVALRGYFDKRALIAGTEAIDREFERIEPLLKRGGFIPHTDHLVPPDVSWENYCYYREKKCEFIGKTPD